MQALQLPPTQYINLADDTESKERLEAELNQTVSKQTLPELRIVVLATTTNHEKDIHRTNINKMSSMEGGRLVLYVINEMNNDDKAWADWVIHADEIGVPVMVRKSGRDVERGFEPKLVSQMALLDEIREHAPFDYLFAIDGDLSFSSTDLPQLITTLRVSRPLIAQPTIQLASALGANSTYKWGSQGFKLLNAGYFRANCPACTAVDAPFIECQAPMLSAEFLDFYSSSLKEIAKFQHRMQCGWGHDEMWCAAASRLSATLPHRPPACLVLKSSLVHWDTKAISKDAKFKIDCRMLENKLRDDVVLAKARAKLHQSQEGSEERLSANDLSSGVGPNSMINNEALLDYESAGCTNLWAEMNDGGCISLSTGGGSQTAVQSYKAFSDSNLCQALLRQMYQLPPRHLRG